MKRRHIAVFTNLGNGHVYSALELCSELVRRGYRVSYATNDHYAPLIRETGAEPVIFKPAAFPNSDILRSKVFDTLPLDDPHWWVLYASIVYPWFLLEATIRLPQLEEIYKNDVPDLILYDRWEFAARILAKRIVCPAILLYSHFAFYNSCLHRENGVCVNPEPMLHFAKLLDSFMSSHGLEQTDNLWHTESLNLYFIPKAFQYHEDYFDDRFLFVGTCLKRPFRPMWKNNGRGKPIVLVSGTSWVNDINYFKMFVPALSDLDCHVILSVGDGFPVSTLGTLSGNFEINQHASHLEILPHTTLAICQGGMNTTLESIYHRVPVISFPLTPSHAEIGYRTVELGVGIQLPKLSMSPQMIRDAVETALGDASLLERVKTMQQVFRNSGGVANAADRIERFIGVRHFG